MKIKRILLLASTILLAINFIGCSYVMDSVEASIMDRASFSITGSYNSTTDQLTLTWPDEHSSYETDSAGTKRFAGYEVYMTHNPNSEYEPYNLIAARYSFSPTQLPSGITYQILSSATSSGAHTLSINPTNKGNYFFRVGVITSDKSGEDANKKDLYYDSSISSNYEDHTTLDKISGSLMINID